MSEFTGTMYDTQQTLMKHTQNVRNSIHRLHFQVYKCSLYELVAMCTLLLALALFDDRVLFHCLISNLKSIYVSAVLFFCVYKHTINSRAIFSIYERFVFHSVGIYKHQPGKIITKKCFGWNYIFHSKCIMFLHALQQLYNLHTKWKKKNMTIITDYRSFWMEKVNYIEYSSSLRWFSLSVNCFFFLFSNL